MKYSQHDIHVHVVYGSTQVHVVPRYLSKKVQAPPYLAQAPPSLCQA